jgi:prevent-host-death family protein
MAAWQVQEAKQRFSEVLREALTDGPQTITRHGEEVAVVIGIELYHQLATPRIELGDFLVHGPADDDLVVERDRSTIRDVDVDELV